MNSEVWQAVVVMAVAGALAWLASRWWYLRRLRQMSRQMNKLDATHQNTLRMAEQARKQIGELQAQAADYRRQIVAAEQARRPRAQQPAAAAPMRHGVPTFAERPGGWADTQPL